MIALSTASWTVVATAAVLYLVTCVRIARRMGRTGRSAAAWFFITLFLTAMPAAIVLLAHQRRLAAAEAEKHSGDGPRRCRHCGALLFPSTDAPDAAQCPSCGMKLDEEHLA